jgi:hypothetical protein
MIIRRLEEEFDDTKGVIISRKSKDRQYKFWFDERNSMILSLVSVTHNLCATCTIVNDIVHFIALH